MLEYIEKFNNLPDEVRQKISSGPVLAATEELENEYGVELATFIIRVVVGELYYKNLTANLIIEYDLEPEVAGRLAKDLNDKVFEPVMDFLNAPKTPKVSALPEVASPFFGNKAAPNPATAPVKPSSPIVRRAPAKENVPANFLEEDKADIAAMGKMVTALKTVPQERTEAMLAEIIQESKVSFASESLRKRFKEIMLSYLRNVRTKVEVRENLLKDFISGGVKMSEADADRILNIAQKKLAGDEEKFSPSPGKVTAKSGASGTSFVFNEEEIKQALAERGGISKTKPADLSLKVSRDVGYDLAALKNRPPFAKASEDKPVADSNVIPVSLTGKPKPEAPVKNIPPAAPKSADQAEIPSLVMPPTAPKIKIPPAENTGVKNVVPVRNDEVKRTAAVMGNKKRMEDIKPAPRIMSPIDELAYMDLVNFRRLDQSPAKRAAKIEEKIALLEKEGIDKKIEGIRVWRLNPVSKTYLSMGQESISSGKTIDEIIKERKEQGVNYLSQDEFEAIMDLNNNLRF